MIFFELFLIVLFLSFPLLLWGYGMIYLSENIWNRNRFLGGMIGGSLSVLVIALFGSSTISESFLGKILTFFVIFSVIGGIVWWMTGNGSPYIRGFLRKVIILHSIIFCSVFLIGIILSEILPIPPSLWVVLSSIGGFLIAASIEEGVKHVSAIGLTAKEFRFTRRDFLIFTFFVTLGFSSFENAIYLFPELKNGIGSILFVGTSRIIFSLTLHVFAASICVMMWWKALSYKFLSLHYIVFFLLGYVGATMIHGVYNTLLDRSYLIPLIVLTGVGYFSVTQWISHDEK